MSNKHMKKYSTSSVIGKCKLKPKWDTTIHLLEGLKKDQLSIPSADQKGDHLECSHIADTKAKFYSHFGKVWEFPIKLTLRLPFNQGISLLGNYPREMKTGVHVHTSSCTQMFIVVLFIVTKVWKLKCPSTGEQQWDVHTREHNSAMKRKDPPT